VSSVRVSTGRPRGATGVVSDGEPGVEQRVVHDERGVQFPAGDDGRRSTSRVSREVLAAAAGVVDPALAEAISGERDWRRRYPRHLRDLTAAAARSEAAASAIARAGLDRLHATFEVVGDDGARPIDEAVAAPSQLALGTREVAGRGERVPELVVPYRGRELRGAELVAQAADWAERGIVEPSFATAIERVVDHPEWLDLRGRTVAALGAGAEMGPTEQLLDWGADVAAVDVPAADVWGRLEATARDRAGRLLVPTRPEGGDGADLTTEGAAVRAWLAGLPGPLLVGNYAYADGAAFVRVAMAADAVIVTLQRERDDVALAYLATPTDVFAVPTDAVSMSRSRQAPGGARGVVVRTVRTLSRSAAFRPAYRATVVTEDGRELGIADALVVQQGPNYALAKRLQRWRALVARQDGAFSSVHVAPPTRTRSVTRNRILAAAYAGAHVFEVEPFEPATSRAVMAALLVHDLHDAESAAGTAEAEHDLTAAAAHGGLWRMAWEPRSALPVAVAVGARALLGR
jgi:hypothetical protein